MKPRGNALTRVNYVLTAFLWGEKAAMTKAFLFALALLTASTAQASTIINFESYPDPSDFVSFTNSGATFTGTGGTQLFEISSYGTTWGTAGPKVLCPYLSSTNYCGGSFNVTFANPVNSLQFYFTGDNSARIALSVQAFLNNVLLGTLSVQADGTVSTAQLVNLGSFGAIDKVSVTGGSADIGGLAYDDFSFNPVVVAVPEPSTWALMLLGFAAIGVSVRRRNFAKPVLG
jgi:hypothetical protein